MQKSFIDHIRTELQEWKDSGKDYDTELTHFPDLLKVLCDLLNNDIIDRESRVKITTALGYVFVPYNLIPSEVYGSYGYMDDLYLVCIVLTDVKEKYPELIAFVWTHEHDIDTVIKVCTFKSNMVVEQRNIKDKLLRYCGMME